MDSDELQVGNVTVSDSLTVSTSRRLPRPAILWLGFVVVYLSLLIAGGEASRFAASGLLLLPVIVLAKLADSAEESKWLRILTIVYWGLLSLSASLLLSGSAVVDIVGAGIFQKEGGDSIAQDLLSTPAVDNWILIALVVSLGAGAIGILGFVPHVRHRFAQLLNLQEKSFSHATALATAISIISLSVCFLVLVQGSPLLTSVRQLRVSQPINVNASLRSQAYSLCWAIPAGLVLVGYPRRRNFREVCYRLRLEWPTSRQTIAALVLAVFLVFTMWLFGTLISWLWRLMNWTPTEVGAARLLFGYAFSPLGAIVVSLTAGFGEELLFRGVLQYRLGVVLTSLLFTSAHVFQYRPDVLLQVFLMGLVLGCVRNLINTPTAAIVHSGYDFLLLLGHYFFG